MSEQAAPAEGGTTPPAVAGPEGTPGTAEQQATQEQQAVDWQDRYQHLQPEYTRVTQENATLREQVEYAHSLLSSDDPDTRRAAAEALGYVLEDEPQPGVNEDPLEQFGERLGRIEESLTQRQQDAEDEAYAEQVRAVVDERLSGLGIPEDDQDWVLAYAINALPITEEGLPDIQQAFRVFQARETERQRAWAQSKQAPHFSPHGQPATEVPNLDNRQERQDWMTRRLMEGEQAGY